MINEHPHHPDDYLSVWTSHGGVILERTLWRHKEDAISHARERDHAVAKAEVYAPGGKLEWTRSYPKEFFSGRV